jgi:AcrR family transcriptional regulator
MAITFTDKTGSTSRENTEAYICAKFLDLVETKPFYTIKVKELAEYASISRSTFYLYFDSIYAVSSLQSR